MEAAMTDKASSVGIIRALSSDVVNRIAAGEVIHRPCSALKELIENSIDAKSTRISVTMKDGGMKMMQIQDNGCGIRAADFPILCERFTTSKLVDYTDLQSISTFGFRGEALASITHVAKVHITSMTGESSCAYQANFVDGVMIEPATGQKKVEPSPCAGVKGTNILIEELFYNVPIRRNALKNSHNEEYSKCLDVLCKYALHYSGQVAFLCKKQGGMPKLDLNTLPQSNYIDNVRTIYGAPIAKELLPVKLSLSSQQCHARGIESSHFACEGYVTNANFHQKKMNFILFINHRLVESGPIRRTLDDIYSKYLPRGTHPFVYLSLAIEPRILDVNVHPTKKEVHFLYEESIIRAIEEAIEDVLKGANNSRVFYTQTVLGGQSAPPILQVHGPTSTASSSFTSQPNVASRISTLPVMMQVRGLQTSAASTTASASASASAPINITEDVTMIDNSDGESKNASVVSTPGATPSSILPLSQAGRSSTFTPKLSQPSSSSSPNASAVGSFFSSVRAPSAPHPSGNSSSPSPSSATRRDNHLVRTDNRQGRIDGFLTPLSPSQTQSSQAQGRKRTHMNVEEDNAIVATNSSTNAPLSSSSSPPHHKSRRPPAPIIQLTSVLNLLTRVREVGHPALTDLFKNHTFVGYVDHTFALAQHQTKLYLINIERISTAFFYETSLRLFGHLPLLRFDQPIPILPMIRMALNHRDGWLNATVEPPSSETELDSYANELTDTLLSRAAMLHEYFALEIVQATDGSALLSGIPELLEQYNPPLILLPLFLLRLARDCDWTSEQACFDTVARCLAEYYRFQDDGLYLDQAKLPKSPTSHPKSDQPIPPLAWTVQHVFFPLLRAHFTPPKNAASDGTVTQIAALENLYKIFERC